LEELVTTINDRMLALENRRMAVLALFAGHVRPGMASDSLTPIFARARWADDALMQPCLAMSGSHAIEWIPAGYCEYRIFPFWVDDGRRAPSVINLTVAPDVGEDECRALLRGQPPRHMVIGEFALSSGCKSEFDLSSGHKTERFHAEGLETKVSPPFP
jgi:hypothetical protein